MKMTRFSRAKGSKASNERLPENSTPWKTMQEELLKSQKESEENIEREKMNKVRQEKYEEFLDETEKNVVKKWAEFPETKSPNTKTKQMAKSPNSKSKPMTKSPNNKVKPMTKSPMNKAKQAAKSPMANAKPNEKVRKILTEDDVTEEMLDEMCEPDSDTDRMVNNLKWQVEEVLTKMNTEDDSDVDRDSDDAGDIDNGDSDDAGDIDNEDSDDAGDIDNEDSDDTGDIDNGDSDDAGIDNGDSDDAGDIDNGDSDDAPEEATAKAQPKKVLVNKQKNKKQALKIKSVNDENADEDKNEKVEHNESGAFVKAPTPNKKQKKNNKKNKQQQNDNQNKDKHNESGAFVRAPGNQNKNDKKNKQQAKNQQQNQTGDGKSNKQNNNKTNNPKTNAQNGNEKGQKRQMPKVRDDKEHKRRKTDDGGKPKLFINGKEEELVRYNGFPIRQVDMERLEQLRKSLISKGVPRSTVERTMKLERRKAEKSVSRIRKQICFQCRKTGHVLSQCPNLNKGQQQFETAGTGICFKCGSTEHSHLQCRSRDGYKFATCFICQEQGHIAKECPDNPKGLYPKGGACKLCGDVTHLKKDCPKFMQEQQENTVFVNTISGGNIDSLDGEAVKKPFDKKTPTKNIVVKF